MHNAIGSLLILVIFASAMVISYWLKEICQTLRDRKQMHKEEIDQSYRDGFEFALINECAKQSTSDASKYAEGYSEGYKRALELVEWKIQNELKEKK